MLLQFMEGVSLKLGMVVDLTKTCRFYDRQDFEKHKIGHYKLQCEGYDNYYFAVLFDDVVMM